MEYKEFLGVEDVWFWFCGIMISEQSGLRPKSENNELPRVCDKHTIYRLLKSMSLSGELTNKHLRVMSAWGQRFCSPLLDKRAKYSEKQIWLDGMKKFESNLIKIGVLDEF